MMQLRVDPLRSFIGDESKTGIFVRAIGPDGKYGSYCISQLTNGSLLEWLRSRGGSNLLAENVVGILLGRGHLHETDLQTNGAG